MDLRTNQVDLLFQVLLDKCQDKRKCSVRANPSVFGDDPCPGTSKYLEVAYKCRPSKCLPLDILLFLKEKPVKSHLVHWATKCPISRAPFVALISTTAHSKVCCTLVHTYQHNGAPGYLEILMIVCFLKDTQMP